MSYLRDRTPSIEVQDASAAKVTEPSAVLKRHWHSGIAKLTRIRIHEQPCQTHRLGHPARERLEED